MRILKNLLNKCYLFVNNIDIKEFKSNYDNKKIVLEIKLFVLKYIQQLDAILINVKLSKYIIFGKKS